MLLLMIFFFFKQKTAYEMRISDWSSDVCSSDLLRAGRPQPPAAADAPRLHPAAQLAAQVVDLGADGHRVGEQGLVRGTMAEVGADRGEHRFAAGIEGVAQAGEIVHAMARVGTIALTGGAQAVEGGGQFGGGGGGHGHGRTIRTRPTTIDG